MLIKLSDGSIVGRRRVKQRVRQRMQGSLSATVEATVCPPMRLSSDVLVKAEAIASEWGLRTSQEAVEAVFRKYADEYMYGRQQGSDVRWSKTNISPLGQDNTDDFQCEAMNELDGLLGF